MWKMTTKYEKCFFCESFKASTSVDCGQIWLKQIVLAQVFAPLQYKNIVLGVGSLKNAECLKSAKTCFCAAFKVSTSVDC